VEKKNKFSYNSFIVCLLFETDQRLYMVKKQITLEKCAKQWDANEDRIGKSDFLKSFTFNKNKRTNPILTKYERARILGKRAKQITENLLIMVELEGETTPLEISKKELKQKKVPFIIRRYLPDGEEEDVILSEMDFIDETI
jgi:DNA-directed RNA polymerase I, II, and III subunit RPABC2